MNLPEVHESHLQEIKSYINLYKVLEESDFIIRDKIENDYGVDMVIEPMIVNNSKKYASNFICQLQIKNKKIGENIILKNKSYSYPLEIKTINYLSSQVQSIFMIYLEKEGFFVWEWTFNIESFLRNEDIDINTTTQKSINYNFYKKLDNESIKEIYNVLIDTGEKMKCIKGMINQHSKIELTRYQKLINTIGIKEQKVIKYLKEKQYRNAFDEYKTIAAISDDEDEYIIATLLGIISNKHKEASIYCNNAISINDKNCLSLYLKGLTLSHRKKYEKAEMWYLKSLEIKPSPEVFGELGNVKINQSKISEAIGYFQYAYYLDSDNQEYNLILGILFYGSSRFSSSLYHLLEYIKHDDKNDFVYALIASNYVDVDEFELAEQYYKKAIKLIEKPEYLIGLSLSLHLRGQFKESKLILRKINKDDTQHDNNIKYLYLGWKYSLYLEITKDNILEKHELIKSNNKYGLDYIYIAVVKDENSGSAIPVIGKKYYTASDYDRVLKEIKNRITFMEDAFLNHQSIDIDQETRVFIKEKPSSVYLKINIGGQIIEGYTNPGNKEGFNGFIKAYEKLKIFQVELSNAEDGRGVFYVITEDNLKYITLY